MVTELLKGMLLLLLLLLIYILGGGGSEGGYLPFLNMSHLTTSVSFRVEMIIVKQLSSSFVISVLLYASSVSMSVMLHI